MAELGTSLQIDNDASAKLGNPYDHGKMNYAYFENGAITTGVGTIRLCNLPAGEIKVFPALSRWVSSAMVSTANVSIGHQAYTEPDGTVVAADDNEWLSAADGSSALDTAFLLPAKPTVYNSRTGIVVELLIDTANIENTDTFHGWVAYTLN